MLILDENSKQLQHYGITLDPGAELESSGSLGRPSGVGVGTLLNSVHLGSMSYISRLSIFFSTTIGNYSSIAYGVSVGMPHPLDRLTTAKVSYLDFSSAFPFPGHHEFETPRTYIGNDVWIGASVVIKAGVRIGDGAIVGAGAIVTKDVPPFAIAVGNPARILRYRFDENTQERIKKCRWFDYDWSGIELPWADAMGTLSRMEELLAEGQVPLANKAYVYTVQGNQMQLRSAIHQKPIV